MSETLTMARPKKPKRNTITVKIDADLVPIAKAIIALEEHGDQIELFSSILRPALHARYERAVKDASKRIEAKKPKP